MYLVYIKAQVRFRKNMSMVDIIFVLHGLITHRLNGGFNLCIVLLLTLLKHLIM